MTVFCKGPIVNCSSPHISNNNGNNYKKKGIIIKTFPKSFAAEKSSMPNNLVSLKPAGIQRRIEITLNNNQFLYKT